MVREGTTFTVLFSSLSAKLALFHSVKKQVKAVSPRLNLLGADSDPNCIGAREVDHFQLMPLLHSLTQLNLLNFCYDHQIQFILPTRDGELAYFAKHKEFLQKNGIGVMVSDLSAVSLCEDKLQFSEKLENSDIPTIPSWSSINERSGESNCYVVKERFGAAAASIGLNLTNIQAIQHAKKLKDPIFQPFIKGMEFSAETWINKKGICHEFVLRWRSKIINGESHESITFRNMAWEGLLKKTLEKIDGLQGHILAQVLVDKNESLHLVEINPRLGGASPLSLEAGLSSIKYSLLEFINESDSTPMKTNIKIGLRLLKKNGIVSIW